MTRPLLAAAFALGLAACDNVSNLDPGEFGDPYRVDASSARLDGDSLRVAVAYSGGCERHTFQPLSQSMGGAWTLWLVHDANGDGCEALVTDTLAVGFGLVPDEAAPVDLFTPAGQRIPLRFTR